MKERKVWSPEQDRILKLLIEDRGMTKWAQISDVMEKEFSIHSRNGKQCRERYHNHLDKNIRNEEWTQQEQAQLFQLQDTYGNKWALISNKLPGRSDNCVKNHFYSKLRKGLRKINKKIHKYLKRDYKDIKTSTLYKIIETMENRNRNGADIDDQTFDTCRRIKNNLKQYDDMTIDFEDNNDELNFIRPIIEDFAYFDKDIKKTLKKGSIKLGTALSEQVSSVKNKTNKISTKSMGDEQQSSYSNSDIFSSSSFDHKSFCSMRSNRSSQLLKPQQLIHRSQSIQSESQHSSDEDCKVLYKSANAKSLSKLNGKIPKKQQKIEQNFGFNSLKLPQPSFHSNLMRDEMKQVSPKSNSSSSRRSSSLKNSNNNMIFTYVMTGEQQPLEIGIFTPKELTIEEKIEIHSDRDEVFYGQKMDVEMDMDMQMFIDSQGLAEGFNNLSMNDGPPKLGRSRDI